VLAPLAAPIIALLEDKEEEELEAEEEV